MNRTSKLARAIAGLSVLLGSGPSRAGQPPCATSDNNFNTACGTGALLDPAGTANSGFGYYALASDSVGGSNTASGFAALTSNTTGSENSGFGAEALSSNTTGDDNTASGSAALYLNTTGNNNTASGYEALTNATTGDKNIAAGTLALHNATTGGDNTALGFNAGGMNTTGSNNTFLGYDANANGNNYTNGTALGTGATLFASNSIVLGNKSITKIYAKVTSITALSDRRQKKDIAALDPALGLDFIEKLQPVSYRFKDGDETQRYGFIAQDLEQALPERLRDTVEKSQPEHGLALIERQNDKDRTYRVAYGELTAPMVKAIQEQQQEIQGQRQEIAALEADNKALRRSVEALAKRLDAVKMAGNSLPPE
jgi:hypothetical protein